MNAKQQPKTKQIPYSKKTILALVLLLSPLLYVPVIASNHFFSSDVDRIQGISQKANAQFQNQNDDSLQPLETQSSDSDKDQTLETESSGFENPEYYYTSECRIDEFIETMRAEDILSSGQEEYFVKDLGNQSLTTAQLGNKHSLDSLRSNLNNELNAGTYMIVLQSYDPHVRVRNDGSIERRKSPQDNEMFGLQLITSSNEVLSKTNASTDLPDDYNSMIEYVQESYIISESDLQRATHIQAYNADIWEDHELHSNGSPNRSYLTSIRTTCFALIPVPEPINFPMTVPPVEVPEVESLLPEDPINVMPETGIIITTTQLQCSADQTNALIEYLYNSPLEIIYIHEYWLINNIVSPCFDDQLVQDHIEVFTTVSPQNLVAWKNLYLNDNQIDHNEVESIVRTLSEEHGVSISIQDDSQE
jgi:hypothetical protein